MDWKTLLAYITGTVDQELLLRNEYLVTEKALRQVLGQAHVGFQGRGFEDGVH